MTSALPSDGQVGEFPTNSHQLVRVTPYISWNVSTEYDLLDEFTCVPLDNKCFALTELWPRKEM